MRTIRILILILAIAGCLRAARALATPVIYGKVTEAGTQEGLLGVNLQLAEALRGTSSDADGDYRLHIPHGGLWTLRVTHIGYRTFSKPFEVGEDDSLRIDIALQSDFLQGDEVLVTAQARESTARLSTTRVEVVGATEVEKRAPGTLDKVLDNVAGLEVHRTGGSVVSNLSIRGSSDMLGGGVGNRTLLLVDGKPAIISDTDGASWWLYPEDVIERVEVVKGAYSALYGSNAMGGVVNLITRSPSHRRVTRIHATYGQYQTPPAWMRYSDRMKSLSSLSFSHANTEGRFGYFGALTQRSSNGWRESSAYENISLFTKLKYDLSPTRNLTLSSLYLTGENEYPHPWFNSLQPLRVRDIYRNDLQQKRSGSLDLSYRHIESPNSSYLVRAFYNRDLTRSLLNPATDPLPGETVPIDFQTRSISQKFGILEQTTRLWSKHNTLVFGVDAVWDEIDGKPDTYLYGNQGAFSPAVYAQDDHSPIPDLHFTFGARFDYRTVRNGNHTQQLSPKAGVSYEILKDLVVRGSVGHAFRNPSVAEMYLKKVGNQDYEFQPNPNLKPERVNFGELGSNLRIDDYATMDGSVFIYKYADVIRWQTLAIGKYRTQNLSASTIKGFEWQIKSAYPAKFKQSAGISYLHTDIDSKGPLTYVPKWRLFYSADWEVGRWMLSGEARYVSKTDTVIFYQNDAPKAYTLVNLRAAMQFHQNTRVAFVVENALNVFYEEMERYRMPPRTFKMEILYDFDVAGE